MTIQKLVSDYPPVIKEQALELLRKMIDNGILVLKNDHISIVNKSP